MGAVAAALWMLAGPVIETTVKHQRQRLIDVLVDTSASMSVSDGIDKGGNAVRWAAQSESRPELEPLKWLDENASQLAVSQTLYEQILAAAERSGKSERIKEAAMHLSDCAGSVEHALRQYGPAFKTVAPGSETELSSIESALSNLPKILDQASSGFTGKSLLTPERLDRLRDAGEEAGRVADRLNHVADEAAAHCSEAKGTPIRAIMAKNPSLGRLDKVAALLAQEHGSGIKDLGNSAQIRRYRFDSTVAPLEENWHTVTDALPAADSDATLSTNLAAPLEQIHRDAAGEPLAAALLFTDGGHNDARDPVKLSSTGGGLPLFIVPIGNTEPLRDVVLYQAQAPRSVFLKDSIAIEATVDAYLCNGEETAVELLERDRVIDRKEVKITGDNFSERIVFTPQAASLGVHEFTLRAEQIAGEALADNNRAGLSVAVVEDKIHVLLADDMPRWEYRYLRNLFKRDEHLEHTEVLFEPRPPDGHGPAEGPGFPANVEGWNRYQVVILGDIDPAVLTEQMQKDLKEYVSRRGGTLILIAGDDYMPAAYLTQPLGEMLPVESGAQAASPAGYTLYLTNEGSALSMTQLADDPLVSERLWREQLPIFGVSNWARPKRTSHLLIGAAPRQAQQAATAPVAFLCWQQVGSGRVIYLSAPLTHRLRYLHGDFYHHRFWGQLMRWAIARDIASGSKTLRVTTDKARYLIGDEVQVSARLSQPDGAPVANARPRAIARKQDRTPAGEVELEADPNVPGSYRGTLKGLPLGELSIGVEGQQVHDLLAAEGFKGSVESRLRVEPQVALELRNTRCNLPLLQKIAEASGGRIIPPTGLAAALKELDLAPEVSETRSRRPVWDRWSYFWIFLGCLTVEWVARKRTGLP